MSGRKKRSIAKRSKSSLKKLLSKTGKRKMKGA